MDNREILCDAGYEESVVFENPDYDSAIVGVTDEGNVVYDFNKMVDHLVERDGMTRDEAVEFIEYNAVRALPYAGEKAPIIITMLKDLI
jgi:hypothetical protein